MPLTLQITALFTCAILSLQAQPGAIDPSFSNDGKVWYDFGFQDNITDITVQPADQKLVAVGTALSPAFAGQLLVLRLNPDGSPDTQFGTNGSVIITTFTESYAYDVKVLSDGKLLIAGASANEQFVFSGLLMRLLPDGSLDTGFGTNGMISLDLQGGDDFVYDMQLDAQGRIVLAGKSINAQFQNQPFVMRLNGDGSPDASFGNQGLSLLPVSNEDNVFNRVAIDAQGRIVACGHYGLPLTQTGQFNLDVLVARFTDSGVLDASFASNGSLILPISAEYVEAGMAMDLDAQGHIYVGGYTTQTDFSFDAILMKLDANGALVNGFGNNGVVVFDQNVQDVYYDLKIGSDQKLYACGTTGGFFFDDRDFLLSRIGLDGTPDATWGETGGFVTTTIDTAFDEANTLFFQADGKVVLGGKGNNGLNNDAAFVRYVTDNETAIETLQGPRFSVWPNPISSEQRLLLEWDAGQEPESLELFDIQGRSWVHIREANMTSQIPLPALAKGVYVLRATKNGAYSTQRVVVY